MEQAVKRMLKSLRIYPVIIPLFHRLFPMWLPQRKKTLQFFSKFMRQGDLCFDVGANRGDLTKAFVSLGARVVSIEPQETCLKQLYQLFRNNKDVIIVGKAVADREGYANFSICEDRNTISTLSDTFKAKSRYSQDHQWTKTQEVSVTTLNALIQRYGVPQFCKIDVEGAEELVLKGLSRPINVVSFEYTREFYDNAKKCVSHLLSLGQVRFNFSISTSMELLFPTWVTSDELFAKLETLQERATVGDIYAKFLST
jgi:FkbM family methyltransferase